MEGSTVEGEERACGLLKLGHFWPGQRADKSIVVISIERDRCSGALTTVVAPSLVDFKRQLVAQKGNRQRLP